MGKITKFDIVFANEASAFYSGHQVTGKVVVDLKEAMKFRAVKLRLAGEALVSFTDTTKAKRKHSDKEAYFDQVDVLFGSAESSLVGESTELSAGAHEFPFVFNAPSHLPSSFESPHGHVRYWAKAYLHCPWKFDVTTKKAFSMVGLVDLNSEPASFTPGYAHSERKFGFGDRLLCCVRGGLSVSLRVGRKAYVPGEVILLNAHIENLSSERVKRVEAYLQQNLILTAKSGSRFIKGDKKIAQLTQGAVARGKTQIWEAEQMPLPSLPPSKLGGCRLMSVDYLLNLVVFVESAKNVSLSIPLVIGTIPLHPTAPVDGTEAVPSAPPHDDWEMIAAPPPSYEECLFMDQADIRDSDDNQYTGGQSTYRPLYPTYATGHA